MTSAGFVPNRLAARSGQPVRLIFLRETDDTCATQVQFPGLLDGRAALPMGRETAIDLTPRKPGDYVFGCPMNMVQGTLVVR
ncbi:MAG: cupredoxin domain-containing protein [Armatimonadetes bacterium]|nr:cupredoxin domain-containing protein [Armatimonadota bacterium]